MRLRIEHRRLFTIVFFTFFANCVSGCGAGADDLSRTNTLLSAIDDEFDAERNAPTVSQNVLYNDKTQGRSIIGLHIIANTQPTLGSVTDNRDGTFTYTPNTLQDTQTDSFTYSVADEQGNTKTATVHIKLKRGWDIPQPVPNSPSTQPIKHFTFSNGDLLLIWFDGIQSIWSRTYDHVSGWDMASKLFSNVSNSRWNVVQNATTESVVVAVLRNNGNGVGEIVANYYRLGAGWNVNATSVDGKKVLSNTSSVSLVAAGKRTVFIWGERVTVDGSTAPITYGYGLYASTLTEAADNPQWSSASKIDQIHDSTLPDSRLEFVKVDSFGRVIVVWTTQKQYANLPGYLWVNALPSNQNQWLGAITIDKPQDIALDGDARSLVSSQDAQGRLTLAWLRNSKQPYPFDKEYSLWATRIDWDLTKGTLNLGLKSQNSGLLTSPVQLQPQTNPDVLYKGDIYSVSTTPILDIKSDISGNSVIAWMNTDTSYAISAPIRYLTGAIVQADGSINSPVIFDQMRNDIDGNSTLIGITSNSPNSLAILWSKEYYPPLNNLVSNPNTAHTEGTKILAIRVISGKLENINGVGTLSDVKSSSRYSNTGGFIKLIAPTPYSTLLFTTQSVDVANSDFPLYVHDLTTWAAGAYVPAPLRLKLSSTVSDNTPSIASYLFDNKNDLTLFWAQTDGLCTHFFTQKYAMGTKKWEPMGPQQLDSVDNTACELGTGIPANFSVNSNGNGTIVATWNAVRNNAKYTFTRKTTNDGWESHTIPLPQVPGTNSPPYYLYSSVDFGMRDIIFFGSGESNILAVANINGTNHLTGYH